MSVCVFWTSGLGVHIFEVCSETLVLPNFPIDICPRASALSIRDSHSSNFFAVSEVIVYECAFLPLILVCLKFHTQQGVIEFSRAQLLKLSKLEGNHMRSDHWSLGIVLTT